MFWKQYEMQVPGLTAKRVIGPAEAQQSKSLEAGAAPAAARVKRAIEANLKQLACRGLHLDFQYLHVPPASANISSHFLLMAISQQGTG